MLRTGDVAETRFRSRPCTVQDPAPAKTKPTGYFYSSISPVSAALRACEKKGTAEEKPNEMDEWTPQEGSSYRPPLSKLTSTILPS